MESPRVDGELSLREVQLVTLAILKKIETICKEEYIRWWVMYGTLIGAVRHHGFIPWDDDLDIAMPRPDYERFLAYFKDHPDEVRPLTVLSGNGERRLPILITRVSDTTYRMVGEYGDEVPELGAFVDVYPIDGCGDTKEEAEAQRKLCRNELLKFDKACNFTPRPMRHGLKWQMKRVRAGIMGNPAKYAERLHDLAVQHRYDNSTFVSCLVWENDLCWHRVLEDTLIPTSFEDMSVPIPTGYDAILRLKYGDYMTLPPEEERVGHHFYAIIRRDSKEDDAR